MRTSCSFAALAFVLALATSGSEPLVVRFLHVRRSQLCLSAAAPCLLCSAGYMLSAAAHGKLMSISVKQHRKHLTHAKLLDAHNIPVREALRPWRMVQRCSPLLSCIGTLTVDCDALA